MKFVQLEDADAEGLSGRAVTDIQRDTRGTPRHGQPSVSAGSF